MINTLLIIAEAFISYLLLIILHKKYKNDGIYIFAIIATVLACMLNLKQISIMNVNVPLGFGITTTIIIGVNLLIQKYGKEEINKYMIIVILTIITHYLLMNIATALTDSEYNLLANRSFDNIFINNTRNYIALNISLIIAIYFDSKLYYIIKRLQNRIIYSNIFSIIIVEFFENIIFVLLAYLFDYKGLDIALCIIFRYIIKTIIGIIGTIPLYIANNNK